MEREVIRNLIDEIHSIIASLNRFENILQKNKDEKKGKEET
jgi:hypothetical protein